MCLKHVNFGSRLLLSTSYVYLVIYCMVYNNIEINDWQNFEFKKSENVLILIPTFFSTSDTYVMSGRS